MLTEIPGISRGERGKQMVRHGLLVRSSVGAVCFVAMLGITGSAPARADGFPDCPAEIALTSGIATYYSTDYTGGNCTLNAPLAGEYWVAAPPAVYASGASCGRCLRIWGPLGSIVARISDSCPSCSASQLDLEENAFVALAGSTAPGVIDIAFRSVECPAPAQVSWLFQGSNPYYIKLQIRDFPYGVSSMDFSEDASWHAMTPTSDGFFTYSPTNPQNGTITVRATNIHGAVVTDTLNAIVNDSVIVGSVQFPLCTDLFLDGFEGGLAPPWTASAPYTPPSP